MLTTHRIQEHFESLEMERLRAEVKELQMRLAQLQTELSECRREPRTQSNSTPPTLPNA